MSKSPIPSLDAHLILASRKSFLPSARFALFLIFAWLGALKVFGLAATTPLVEQLHSQLFSSLLFDEFYMVLGIYEVVLGLALIIKGFERAAFSLLLLYWVATSLPIVLATDTVWQTWFVPTLVGEQAIKNIVLTGIAIGIASQLAPVRRPKNKKDDESKKAK